MSEDMFYPDCIMFMEEDGQPCQGCSATVIEPYIECATCGPPTFNLCLHCFARGVEAGQHQNDHSYIVVKDDFKLFEHGWTAGEDLKLIQAISDCGVGNWADVAYQVRSKTKQQCEQHYNRWYIENQGGPLPVLPDPDVDFGPAPIIYKVCEDPPRPIVDSAMHQEMSGYQAARGDFTHEFDNFAELDLQDMDFDNARDDDELDKALKIAVLDVYQNRLKERHRRKKIVRNYGLINLKKVQVANRRYEKAFGTQFHSVQNVSRLLPPHKFDLYLESLLLEHEFKQGIQRLQDYREAGVTKLQSGMIYDRLKASREKTKAKRHLLTDVYTHIQDETACQQWLQKQASVASGFSKGTPLLLPNTARRSAPPLNIVTLPGYEKLSDKERELCSAVRLVPEAYLEFRNILSAESNKHGYLKLAQARGMIKIDVNKTRKIYDFLVNEGYIKKDVT